MRRNRGQNKKVVYLRPKKKSFKLTYVVILILCVVVFVLLFKYFSKKTYIVEEGNLQKSFTSNAVIIRQEKLIKAPVEGKLEILVDHGNRVRVGEPLFRVICDMKKYKEYKNQIVEVEDKIKVVKAEQKQQKMPSVLDKSIEDTTRNLQDAISKGEFKKVDNLKSELIRLKKERNKKNKIREKNIKTMQESLQDLKVDLQNTEHTVYAPISGIISYNIDGMEELLSPSNIQNITYDKIKDINIKKPKTKREKRSFVDSNQPVLKIIDNFSYYMAVPMKNKLQEGKNYVVKFTSFNKATKGKLIQTANKPEFLGIFRLNSDIKELLNERKVEVEVLVDSFYGKIVPTDSLITLEGKEGVYLIKRSKRFFKPVKVIAKNDKYAIIEGLKIGDKILLN